MKRQNPKQTNKSDSVMTLYTYPKHGLHTRADTDRLIAQSLARFLPDLPKPPVLLRTASGKPFFEGDFPQLGVTHSDSVVIIALADTPFGIDCEDRERRVKHRDALCKRFFSAAEQGFVKNAGAEEEKTRLFLELWVKKEAYVKYTGEGLKALAAVDTTTLSGRFENRSDEQHILYIYYP